VIHDSNPNVWIDSDPGVCRTAKNVVDSFPVGISYFVKFREKWLVSATNKSPEMPYSAMARQVEK